MSVTQHGILWDPNMHLNMSALNIIRFMSLTTTLFCSIPTYN